MPQRHCAFAALLGSACLASAPARATEAPRFELRLQTAGQGALALTSSGSGVSGLTYITEGEAFALNLAGGFGYFVAEVFGLGVDVSVAYASAQYSSATMALIAPFAKWVPAMSGRSVGPFVEPSVGIGFLETGSSSSFRSSSNVTGLFLANLWAGGHFFVSDSSAILVGPYFAYLRMLASTRGADAAILGLRLGVSLYL